ncbi:hypothetical protein PSPO01_15284 [Paraphaeosphaeria sporulosa]
MPGRSIDLATAENWLIRSDLLELLRENFWNHLELKHLSYAGGLGGPPELLAALAKFYNCFFEPSNPVEPDHLVVGPGSSSIIDTLINDICDDGDGLLVAAPMWGSFEISAVLRNSVRIIPVQVPFREVESAQGVVSAYRIAAQKATCNIRGILFCNPHNPSGHISRPEVTDALLQYCEEEDLHFISDEVYALSTFGAFEGAADKHGKIFRSSATNFVSVLQKHLQGLGVNPSRVHQVYSFSKDFGSSGVRLGCLVTQANKGLRMSQAILNNAKMCNFAAVVFTPFLNDLPKLRTLVHINKYRLREAAQIAVQFAEFHGQDYFMPAAGLYIWIRLLSGCTNWNEEEQVIQRCAEHGVSIGGGADYAELCPGWFRLTFAVSQTDFLIGIQRIEEALGYKTKFHEYVSAKTGVGL